MGNSKSVSPVIVPPITDFLPEPIAFGSPQQYLLLQKLGSARLATRSWLFSSVICQESMKQKRVQKCLQQRQDNS